MITIAPAELRDLGELKSAWHPKSYKAAVVQLSRSPALTLRDQDSGKVVAVCGLYPETTHGEAWLFVAPDIKGTKLAAPTIKALVAVVRSLPARMKIAALVRTGYAPGERIAGLLGLRNAGPDLGGLVNRFERNP